MMWMLTAKYDPANNPEVGQGFNFKLYIVWMMLFFDIFACYWSYRGYKAFAAIADSYNNGGG